MGDLFATAELFPLHSPIPAGFSYVLDFLSRAEETRLLHSISKHDLHPLLFQGFEAKRKVISFGYDYSFDRRTLTKGKLFLLIFNGCLRKLQRNCALTIILRSY